MFAGESRLKKILRPIRRLLELPVLCLRGRPSEMTETDEKLLTIFNELTVGISEVFDDTPEALDEYLHCDRVSCKISVLSEQIGQVRILYSLWKNGYDLNPRELMAKLQSLNVLVDCIRDDVFNAYLRLPAEQKLRLLKTNTQVSVVFAVLGSLENEVSGMAKAMNHDELMKSFKPRPKPDFNRVVSKRQVHNHYYDFQAVQFTCENAKFEKPKTVDAWTDAIEYEFLNSIGSVDSRKFLVGDSRLDPPDQISHSHSKSVKTKDSKAEPQMNQSYPSRSPSQDPTVNSSNSKTFTSPADVPIGRLDSRDKTSQHSYNEKFTHSQLHSEKDNVSEQYLSFWKMAAELLGDQPVKG